MRTLTSHEIIVAMLQTYLDVCGAGERGEGSDVSDDRLLMMNPLWREGSYAELYRCLVQMRNEEPSLYWHLAQRYLRCQQRRAVGCIECRQPTNQRHTHHVHGLRQRFDPQPFMLEVWHPRVDRELVEISERNPRPAAVDWIVRCHRGSPFLPDEIYRLVAA